jgi:2,3-bisphosphoglycerate-independent phosphoglycerate mutase
MADVYQLKPAAIVVYPMYKGLARLIGMEILKTGTNIDDEFTTLRQNYADHDFFFLHVKWLDSAGEDGDFDRKVKVIEEFDRALPGVIGMEPDVMVVTGDHSTPAVLSGHSWHPVPVLLYSKWCRPDRADEFSESACLGGGLGHFPATQIMSLAMAHALKLTKLGA